MSADSQPRAIGRSDEREHEQSAGGEGVGRQAVLARRGAAARRALRSTTSLADEPDSEERDDAEDDPHPGAVGEGLREDAPGVVRRRLDRVVLHELSRRGSRRRSGARPAAAARRRARRSRCARSSSLRRPRASQTASAATASATSHIQSATARRIFVIVCAVSSWLSSMIAIFPEDSGQPLGDLSDHRHLVAELDHDRAQVEHDRAALGLDEGRVVVEQAHELALRPGRHLHPHRLHTRPLERGVGCPIGARARETGQNRGEPLLCRRQSLGDRRLDVDVREQRVDRLGRDLCSDLVVLDHVPRDRLEARPRRGRCARRRRRPSRRARAGSRGSSGRGRR